MACGLCGHEPACGSASVTQGVQEVWLCHADDHSCYHQWTVYDARPYSYVVITGGAKGGKGVLVTQSWREAATDIRAKLDAGLDVMVRRDPA